MPIGLAKFKRTRIMLASLHTSTPRFFKKENTGVADKNVFLKNVNFQSIFFKTHLTSILDSKSFLSGESNEKITG